MVSKIGVVGGGNVGGVLVQEIVRRGLARSVGLVDVAPPDLARGKALDISEGTPILRTDVKLEAGKEYDVLAGSEIVINTAGVPRKPRPDGTVPSREELLATNLKITDAVAAGISRFCPSATIISIANPLDAIVYRLHEKLSPPRAKIMGMAGVLDSARYRFFVAQAVGVSVANVEALVLGGHGDDMVPVRSCCRIAGMPVENFLTSEALDAIEKRVRGAGAEVVKLLGVGSAFASPAWAALEMAEAIAFDQKKILPAAALLNGEYGVRDLFIGVPCVLGAGGIERIIEVDLTEAEKVMFRKSVASVTGSCAEVARAM